jgi:hypothetical protein
LGAGERILLRSDAEISAYGIGPNVPGDCFGVTGLSQNVIVVVALPKAISSVRLICKTGLLFEGMKKRKEFGGILKALEQEMQVVGHHAVGVEKQIVSGCGGEKVFN